MLGFRADTGEILCARMRKGSANTARGMKRFLGELAGHLTHAGWAGKIVLRHTTAANPPIKPPPRQWIEA